MCLIASEGLGYAPPGFICLGSLISCPLLYKLSSAMLFLWCRVYPTQVLPFMSLLTADSGPRLQAVSAWKLVLGYVVFEVRFPPRKLTTIITKRGPLRFYLSCRLC